MKDSTGCPTKTVTRVSHMRELVRGEEGELSTRAKARLKILDYYYCYACIQRGR